MPILSVPALGPTLLSKKFINKKKKIFYSKITKVKKESLTFKLVKLQLSLKPEFNFKINFNLEKYIQGFFDKISETISSYKILKHDEKRRLKIEKIENERKAKIEIEKQKTIELKDEQNQLLIEESSKSGNGRISEYARNKLKMNPPEKKQKKLIK